MYSSHVVTFDLYLQLVLTFLLILIDFDTTKPDLFKVMENFIKGAPRQLSDAVKEARWQEYGNGNGSLEQLAKEVDLMKKLVEKHSISPLGFTHNDLLLANVLYNEEKTRVTFIDYEYSSYNYVYFDIANHFTEYAGTDVVDHSLYPDERYQRDWLSIYLKEKNRLLGVAHAPITDDELELVRNEVNLLALCAHLCWAIWCIIQAEFSTIDYDYVHFGIRRLDGYYNNKEKFTKPFM